MLSSRMVLKEFEKISRIPRCSKQEEKIRAYLKGRGQAAGFASRTDQAGNLLLAVPASPGAESAPTLVLQAHLDMVCEKTPESRHDFTRDPLRLRYDGDWLTAEDTSLGADNGIGLALALALAEEKELPHPPLELLFTVDEETGLTGAAQLAPGFFSGRVLINLDSEDEGVFIIGCAGGRDCELILPLDCEAGAEAREFHELQIGGLRGGHSGVDIHEQRGNANVLLARTLGELRKYADIRLAALRGGSARNAIPRQAAALLAIKKGDPKILRARLTEWLATLAATLPGETGLTATLTAADPGKAEIFSQDTSDRVIDLLLAAPDGVLVWSRTMPGLVETLVNLATIDSTPGQLTVAFSQRSDQPAAIAWLTAKLTAQARLAGGRVVVGGGYPGWRPEPDSPLLARARRTYHALFGEEPQVRSIHAGLECGLIGAANPGLEMLSLGPTVKNPHSPQEKLYLPSLERICRFLPALLASYLA